MSEIVKILKEKEGFVAFPGASEKQIRDAEGAINLEFAADYREYVAAFGAAAFDSHELVGVCIAPRLSVVEVTKKERGKNPDVPADWYVIEQLNIDDAVIWQNTAGEIFQTLPGTEPVQLFTSLSEYLKG